MRRTFPKLTIAALLATTALAPSAHADIPPFLPGISPRSSSALQLTAYDTPVPFDWPGSPYRQMLDCATDLQQKTQLFDVNRYYFAAACLIGNPFSTGRSTSR